MRILGFILLLASLAAADVVHMKDGRKIEGKVTDLGDKVKIERSGITITVDKSEVERIEVKEYKEPEKTASPTKSRPKHKVRLTSSLTTIDGNFVLFTPNGWGGNSPVIRGPIPGPDGLKLDWGVTDGVTAKLEESAAAMKKEIQAKMKDAAFSGEQSWTQGGRPCMQFEVASGKKTTLVQLMKNGDSLIHLSFAADDKIFDKRWHEVNMMLRSVKWMKRMELTREQKDKFMDLYEKGYGELAANRGEEALTTYKEAAAIIPDLPVIHSAIGYAHLQMKNYREAVVSIQKALKIEPDNVIDLWQLAMSYYLWGKEDEAINAFKRVMEADPDNEGAFVNCGMLYANKEKWFDAKDAFKRGAQKNPDSVALHFYWGQAAERCEKFSEAKDAYEKVLKLDPNHAEAKQRLEELKKKK